MKLTAKKLNLEEFLHREDLSDYFGTKIKMPNHFLIGHMIDLFLHFRIKKGLTHGKDMRTGKMLSTY